MLLEAIDIHKSYGSVQVLKGVNLQLQEAEVLSVMGASGAGKSTLLHILGTLDTLDRGQLLFEGQPLHQASAKQLNQIRNRALGFVFQFHNLLPEFTALENAAMPALIQGMDKAEAYERAAYLLEYLGVAHRAKHEPGRLSGGEAQRVAVARALVNRPRLVLADEPSGNLDEANAIHLHELFLKLREDFRTAFIIVTHHKELAKMADRGVWLKDGMIAEEWQRRFV